MDRYSKWNQNGKPQLTSEKLKACCRTCHDSVSYRCAEQSAFEEHQKDEFVSFPAIWQGISETIAEVCLSMPMELPKDLSKYYNFFSVKQKKRKGIWKQPKIIQKKIQIPLPENTDEIYEFIKTSTWTTKNELAYKLLSENSPAYQLLHDYAYKCQCLQKVKKELECVVAKLYRGANEVSMQNILQDSILFQ